MKKRVFRSKILYWVSVLFFSISALSLLTSLVGLFNFQVRISGVIYLIIIGVLSIIICIKLFEKEKNAVLFINIFMTLILIPILYHNILSFLNERFPDKFFTYLILITIYLILINRNKVRAFDIEEIENIGNN